MVLSFISRSSRPRRHLYRQLTSVSAKALDWCSHAKEVLEGYESSDDERKILKGKRYRFLLESVQSRQVRTTRPAVFAHRARLEWVKSRSSRATLIENA